MEQAQPMDLGAFDTRKGAEQGFRVQLRHPQTDAPLAGWIRVQGEDSAAWQDKMNELLNARIRRMGQKRKQLPLTAQEVENDNIELLVAVTQEWGCLAVNGQDLAFSPEAAAKFYRDFPAFRDQVLEEVKDRGNFLPRSGTS